MAPFWLHAILPSVNIFSQALALIMVVRVRLLERNRAKVDEIMRAFRPL